MKELIVYCADIGSIRKHRFGWARDSKAELNSNSDIRELVQNVAKDLNNGNKVALGFECPLFVPISDDPIRLTSARDGEGNRAWCAGAGAGALATGLTETIWILKNIRDLIKDKKIPAFLSWPSFDKAGQGIFLWEAFVSGEAHGENHIDDAKRAVQKFLSSLPNIENANAITEVINVHSLIGAALLRTGWSEDLALLKMPCLVIKG